MEPKFSNRAIRTNSVFDGPDKNPICGSIAGGPVFLSVAMSDPICGLEHIHPLPKGHQGSHVPVSNTIYQLETRAEMDRTFNSKPVSVLQCLASQAAILLVRTFKLTIAYIRSRSALTLMRVYISTSEGAINCYQTIINNPRLSDPLGISSGSSLKLSDLKIN